MKICFLTNSPFAVGGVERVLSVLSSELAKSYDITIACTKNYGEDFKLYNLSKVVNVEVIPDLVSKKIRYPIQGILRKLNGKYKLSNIMLLKEACFPIKERKKIIKYFKSRNFDLIVGVQDNYALLISIICEDLSARCFGWFHNSYRAYFETPNKYSWHKELLYKNYISNLELCVTLTKKDEQDCNASFGNLFKNIYNPLTCTVEKISDLSKNNIVFVGRLLYEQKGLDYFIDIVKLIIKKCPNVKFIVVGDGPDRYQFEKHISDEKLVNYVECVGNIKNIGQYYSDASVLISTSRWEGFGLSITEAMSHGVPVVSFDNEGPSEIISSGLNGFLISDYNCNEFASKIELLITNRELCCELGRNALERSKDFSLEKVLSRWKEYIKG